MPKHLVVTDTFSPHSKGDIITDPSAVTALQAGADVAFFVPISIGLLLDGAAYSVNSPTVTAGGKVAAFPLPASFGYGAVMSAGTVPASGKAYVAFLVNFTGTFNSTALAGFCGPGFDITNPVSSLSGHCALVASTTTGSTDEEIGADTFLLSNDPLVDGAILQVFIDFTDTTWGCITPDGTRHDNAQAQTGVGSVLLGFPAGGAFGILALFVGEQVGGPCQQVFTVLKESELIGLGKTPPAGYVNVAG